MRKQVHPWRVVIVVGGLALVVSLFAFLGFNSDTSDEGKQAVTSDVNQVAPAPGVGKARKTKMMMAVPRSAWRAAGLSSFKSFAIKNSTMPIEPAKIIS